MFKMWKILDFINFNAILWIFIDSTRVSMNFPYISPATGLFPWCSGKGCQLNWIHLPSQSQGCGKSAVVWPLVILLSCCLVWVFPRGPSMKIWSRLGVELCQFCPERHESQRYRWAKIHVFGNVQPSVVDRGVVNWMWFCSGSFYHLVVLYAGS